MASAMPIHGKGRRSSSSRFSSPPTLSRLPSSLESPRTLCPQDQNAFTFKAELLSEWAMDDELWKQLPASVRKVVVSVQHAGAAALTSLERLEALEKKLPEPTSATTLHDATASDAIALKLHEHQARTSGRARSSTRDKEEYNCSPLPLEPRGATSFSSSQTVHSSNGTESTGYVSPAARMSPPSLMSPTFASESYFPPVTPFELGESPMPTISRRESEVGLSKPTPSRPGSDVVSRTFSSPGGRRGSYSVLKEMPRDPASNQYFAELEHFRKVDLVRLRHSTRPVDVEWAVVKHDTNLVQTQDGQIPSTATINQVKEQFEQWWISKKQEIARLDEQGKDMCAGVHFSLGWSDTPGLDHGDFSM